MDFVYDLLQTRDRLGETLQIGEDQSVIILFSISLTHSIDI